MRTVIFGTAVMICVGQALGANKWWKGGAGTLDNTTTNFYAVDATGGTLVACPSTDTCIFSAGTTFNGSYVMTGTPTYAGLVLEEGTITLNSPTAITLGAGPITINTGANLVTDSSLRVSTTAGSVYTLNGGGLTTANPSAAGSFVDIDSTIVLNGGGTINYTLANVLNIVQTTTTIGGTGPLIKTGVGVIAIASTCSYSGATIINGGELRIRTTANRLPTTTPVTVTTPGILNLNSVNQQIDSLTGTGDVGTGSGTLTISGSASTVFNGALKNIANAGAGAVTTGNGKLTKSGSGTITFAGLNDINGTVTLSAGGITVNAGASLCGPICDVVVNGGTLSLNNNLQVIENLSGSGGTIALAPGHFLIVSNAGACTYSGTITGAGGIGKTNNGGNQTLTLSGANSYNGATVIGGGRLSVGSATALGSVGGDTTVSNGAELLFDGATTAFTIAEPLKIAGPGLDGGAITIQNSANIVVSGPVTLTADAAVTVSATGTGVFNNPNSFTSLANQNLLLQGGSGAGGGGTISGSVSLGNGGLTKLQAGRWVLAGACNYTGQTLVGAGTLWITGTLTGSPVLVTNGTLGGNGVISGPVSVTSPGILAPGTNGIGTLTINNSLSLGGTATMEINRSVAPNSDRVTGLTTVNYGGTLTVNNIGAALQAGDTFTLFSAGSYLGSFGIINLPALTGGLTWDTSQLGVNGQISVKAPPIQAPETFFTDLLLPPTNSVYIPPPLTYVSYGTQIIIRNAKHRNFNLGQLPPPLGQTNIENFSSGVDFEYSTDGGVTFQSASGAAAVQVRVVHTLDSQGVSYYDTEMLQLDLTAPGFMLRESPTLQSLGQTTSRPVSTGYMISSFFDVWTELSTDGGITWIAPTNSHHMVLRKNPKARPPVPEPTPLLPPPNDKYVSPQQWHALYAQGIEIKDISHKFFTTSHPPPTTGTNTHIFSSTLDMQVSTDGGNSFQFVRVTNVPVSVDVSGGTPGSDVIYDTEMTSLNVTLPSGLMVRESPTLASRGATEIQQQPDGTYLIGSFFDIFTEVSTDGGATWSPNTNGPGHTTLVSQAPETPKPNPNLPPTVGSYVSPAAWHALYAQGIIITNASHDKFTQTQPPPPPGGSQIENFSSSVGFQYSTDGGVTFTPATAQASVQVKVSSRSDLDALVSNGTRFFDTDMTSLDIAGGNLPPGVMIRESPTLASLGKTSVRQDGSNNFHLSSFFDIFTEISTDSGATWSPMTNAPGTMSVAPSATITVTCSSNITVAATGPGGAVVNYTVSASGGCNPPPSVVAIPPSGSTFPIGTNIVTVTASDGCGQSAQCTFQIIVTPPPPTPQGPEYFFPQPVLPPPNSVYISPALWHLLFNNGIVIRDVRHRFFTQTYPLPPLGSSQMETFSSELDFDLSTDNGATFTPSSGTANVTVNVTHNQDAGGTQFYDTEMLQLDLTVGTIHLRESPTLQSTGQTTVRPVAGGYLISSFFDVFAEVSLDNGISWTPAQQSGHVEMHPDPKQVTPVAEPTPLLPPPSGTYVSPQLWHALYAQGIVIRDVRHKLFTGSLIPPAAGNTNVHNFNSQLDVQLSTDGGNTYQYVRVAAPVTVTVAAHGSGANGFYDTEMTALSLGLPNGVMIRESPTLPSRGQTEITPQGDGTYQIGSFFDVFTELSLDGGASWSPATNGPVRVELTDNAPEVPKPSPNLPPLDGSYVSPQQWHALYASGIIITNASHDRFTQTQPPPPPGGNQTENFGSRVRGLISMNGGASFQPFSAPAAVQVQVTSRADEDYGPTRFFDTEMLSLSLSGGSLPAGVMVRESPTRASLGRTSVRTDASAYQIGSFFDIFTEVSTDGGLTWSPSITHPGTMGLNPPPTNATLTITCPSNITVTATSPGGAVVFYTVNTTGGCPPVGVVANPPSGSTFPIGTTTVNASASDNCGQNAQCSFTVTVRPPVLEYFTPIPLLPPPNTVYISPALWHVLFNNGIVIRDVRHRFFTQNYPLPPLGSSQSEFFSSELDFDLSMDNGATFAPATGTANVTVHVTHSQDSGGTQFYDTEMLQLDLVGPGFMLRESPTLQSLGQTTVRPVAGGYLIGSFFDVFTEVSTDGGVSWLPAQQSGHVELRNDPATAPSSGHPSALLPPPTGVYISPQQWHALFAQGIVIKDVKHKFFTQSFLPPTPGNTDTHSFNSVVDMMLSLDGGASYQFVRVAAPVTVAVSGMGSGSSGFYDTEMTSLTLSGLPGGLMIRESPTLPSRGGTLSRTQPDGTYHIGSFFDIFTELSTDGGASWSGATNGPVRMHLTNAVPEVPKPNPNLPPLDGSYVSPAQWHALYANGVIITNASHDRFTQTYPPPPPGGNQPENFGSTVSGLISMNGGASFQPFSAPANVIVQVNSRSDEDNGNTRYFDTEMLSLSLSGGTLPGGVMVRESPTRASLGRTSVRSDASGYQIGSFFDIFTELSLDGGATWSPSVTAPGGMGLNPPPTNTTAAIQLNCSSNITAAATSPSGATVFFTSSASGGCSPPPSLVCNPPSGSTFPIGTTTVTCTASDACGTTTNCSFTVTVYRPPITVTCSSNLTVNATSSSGAVVFYSSSASGGCTPPPSLSCMPPSGSTFPMGTTTVTCSANDTCGTTTNCSFTVTVKSPPINLTCSSNITVVATSPSGAVVTYSSSATGGCSPPTVVCNPPSGSTFPVGTTTVTCNASDTCGGFTNCSFLITVLPPLPPPLEYFSVTNVLPPPETVYISPALWHALYGQGIIIRDIRHRFFTQSLPPPPIVGGTQVHTFGSEVDFDISTDNGNTYQPVTAAANVSVQVTYATNSGGVSTYTTEMLSLDLTSGNIRLRESPTLQSTGQTTVRPVAGGFMATSFFDIFTEMSLDGGTTWHAASQPAHVDLHKDPRVVPTVTQPTPLLPSPNDGYISPAKWHALYAQGIVIKDVSHKFFTGSLIPPSTGQSNSHVFNSTVDLKVSTDGGQTFQFVRVTNAPVQVTVASTGSGSNGMYETEMTGLTLDNGLPPGMKIRESPTLPSRGGTQIDPQPDGTYRIGSFFDIFPEISLNNGQTWQPNTNGPVRMQLTALSAEVPSSSQTLPITNAPYVSPADWHAAYASGIYISNVTHRGFTQGYPPPPPGGSQPESFGSTVDLQISTDGGHTFVPASVQMNANVLVTSHSSLDTGGTRFFDTEMLSLDLSGSTLPGGIRLRESPSKASLGRTSIRPDGQGGYKIDSFFDIFTELSTDGGATWQVSTNPPARMAPRLPPRKRFFPRPNLPPTNSQYISPKQWHALYANGIIVSNVSHKRFLANMAPPAPRTTNTHNFGSIVTFLLKMPGGQFQPMTANADCQVSVGSSGFQGKEQVFQTEMLSLNLSGGSLPPGVMIRESPSRRSTGESRYGSDSNVSGSYRVSSFFDIFTEISTDGGQNWTTADSPGYMELHVDPGVPPTMIVQPRLDNGVPKVSVATQLGLNYLLQYKNNLEDPTWTTISITAGTGDQLDLIDCCPPPGPGRPHRFYRVEIDEDDTY